MKLVYMFLLFLTLSSCFYRPSKDEAITLKINAPVLLKDRLFVTSIVIINEDDEIIDDPSSLIINEGTKKK